MYGGSYYGSNARGGKRNVNQIFTLVLNETVAIVEALTKMGGKALNEMVLVVDTWGHLAHQLCEEVVTIVEDLDITSILAKVFNEAVTVVENFFIGKSLSWALSEAVSVADSMIARLSKVISESLSLVDTFVQGARGRIFAETISVSERFRTLLNGLLIGVWGKVSKPVTSYTIVEKVVTTFTTLAKPITTWRVKEKPND